MRIMDWSSDVCSSDRRSDFGLLRDGRRAARRRRVQLMAPASHTVGGVTITVQSPPDPDVLDFVKALARENAARDMELLVKKAANRNTPHRKDRNSVL